MKNVGWCLGLMIFPVACMEGHKSGDLGRASIASEYRHLALLSGDEQVPVEDRVAARNLLAACSDPRVLEVLVEFSQDNRICNPDEIVGQGNGQRTSMSVGAACRQILDSWFFPDPRTRRSVDWKDWWPKNKHLQLDEMRAILRNASQ